jgi:hypothetical protein
MIIAASALGAWGGLLLFTYYVRPTGTPAILVVFVLLALALPSTCVLLTYLVLWLALTRRGQRPRWLQVLREGGLISAWLLFNLALSTLHSWSLFTAIVSFGIIVVVELLVLGQA